MFVVVLLIFLFLFPTKLQAVEPTVVLNEIFAPSSNDWVEIYNKADSEIDISEWKIEDGATTPMKIFPAGTKIAPKGFLAIEVSNRLNNTGGIVRIVTKDGIETDIFEYAFTIQNKSFARLPNGVGNWVETEPTKSSSNGAQIPTQPSVKKDVSIILSEFMPNPDGGSEWVEVYNPNNFELDIGGWKIDDTEGGSFPFSIPPNTKINAKGYKVFSFTSKLNNAGDSIRLLNPNGAVVEKYDFSNAQKGLSFAKDQKGVWKLTTTATPGTENKITFAQGAGPLLSSATDNLNADTPRLEAENLNPEAFADYTIGNYTKNADSAGKVAGLTKTINKNNKFSTLSIAAGISFVLTALVWPLFERGFLIKQNRNHKP